MEIGELVICRNARRRVIVTPVAQMLGSSAVTSSSKGPARTNGLPS